MLSRQSAGEEIAKKTKILLEKWAAKPQPIQKSVTDSNGLRGRIAARAYALFEERGYRYGDDLRDWLDAEREILGHQRLN